MARQPSNAGNDTAVKTKSTASKPTTRRAKTTRKRSTKKRTTAKDADENTPAVEAPEKSAAETRDGSAEKDKPKKVAVQSSESAGESGKTAKKARRRRKRKIRTEHPPEMEADQADADSPEAAAEAAVDEPETAAETEANNEAGAVDTAVSDEEAAKSTERKRRRKRKRKKPTETAPADTDEKPVPQPALTAEKPEPVRSPVARTESTVERTELTAAPSLTPRGRKTPEPFGAGLVDDESDQLQVAAPVGDLVPPSPDEAYDPTPTGPHDDVSEGWAAFREDIAEQLEELPALPAALPAPSAEEHEGGDSAASKLVLKRRPKRRARRGRRRGQGDGERDHEQDHELEHAPEQQVERHPDGGSRQRDHAEPQEDTSARQQSRPAPSAAEDKKSDEPKKRRRKRSSKRKKAQQPVAEPEIKVIGEKDREPVPPPTEGGREMIINVTAGAECRIAIVHEGRLEELYIERQSAGSHVGNIYKGYVTNVEPSIQAAFVDFGLNKNGFLHISDVRPQYFPGRSSEPEPVGKKVPRRDRPPIQKCFRRGDEVLVQVAKEGVGTKGPTLTTYLSIPGRFMVMMPGMNRLGVSRKIEDENDRRAMRELLNELSLPDDMGFILRTAGLNRTKRELQGDLNYLVRLWKTVEQRISNERAPCELYQESDLVIRTIRDVYSSDFARIVVDDADTAQKAKAFLQIAMPRSYGEVVEYRRHEPIFHFYGIEQEIQQIHSRHVPLPSGGSIVIDTTEAMVAIDVNSGKYRELADAEETAYRTNLEAAGEIARQLRLRDLGGLVVCDFIDMRLDRHKRSVEKALRDALKKHKERARILRLSKFGLIEMTRQRQRPSIKRSVFNDCPHCNGSGLIKTPESVSLEVMRILQLLIHKPEVHTITLTVSPPVSTLVLNERRSTLHQLEKQTGKRVRIQSDSMFARDQVSYECADDRGMPLRIEV